MAKIELARDIGGITLEANYFVSGVCVIFIAMLLFVPPAIDYKFPTKRMVPTWGGGRVERTDHFAVTINTTVIPTVLPIAGVLLMLIGVMTAGTSQVLRYDIAKQQISYDSTIALFSGYSKSYTTERLESMVYNLHKVTHQRNERFNEKMMPSALTEHRRTYVTTWNGVLTLWYEGNYNVEFPKISHSESLEEGLKEIAAALEVRYERHELDEKRNVGV